jgi:hypothetical protein
MSLVSENVAWRVVFKRDRYTASYKTEEVVVIAPDERLQLLLIDTLRSKYPEATIETAERLGDALIIKEID